MNHFYKHIAALRLSATWISYDKLHNSLRDGYRVVPRLVCLSKQTGNDSGERTSPVQRPFPAVRQRKKTLVRNIQTENEALRRVKVSTQRLVECLGSDVKQLCVLPR